MQIDIFSELTGILDPCEGIEQSPETSAEKNTFSQETTKRNFLSERFPMQVLYCGCRNKFMAKGKHHCLER